MRVNKTKLTCCTLGHDRVFYDSERYDDYVAYNKSQELHAPEPMAMEEFLGQLIWPLVDAYPQWEFHGDYSYHGSSINRVYVWDQNEQIGYIQTTVRGNKRVWLMTNDRILSKLDRGSGRQTADLNKALKIIKKEFGPKTISETVIDEHMNVLRSMHSQTHQGSNIFRRQYENIFYHVVDYVMGDGFDKLCEIGLRNGLPADWPANVKDAWETNNIRQKIQDAVDKGDGHIVVLHGGYYAVSPPETHGYEQTVYYDDDTLPANIKRGVGMLKLAENDSFVREVGVRCSETTFFILKELGV